MMDDTFQAIVLALNAIEIVVLAMIAADIRRVHRLQREMAEVMLMGMIIDPASDEGPGQ